MPHLRGAGAQGAPVAAHFAQPPPAGMYMYHSSLASVPGPACCHLVDAPHPLLSPAAVDQHSEPPHTNMHMLAGAYQPFLRARCAKTTCQGLATAVSKSTTAVRYLLRKGSREKMRCSRSSGRSFTCVSSCGSGSRGRDSCSNRGCGGDCCCGHCCGGGGGRHPGLADHGHGAPGCRRRHGLLHYRGPLQAAAAEGRAAYQVP